MLAAALRLVSWSAAGAQTLDDALAQLRSGSYDEAISAFRKLTSSDGSAQAYVGYVTALATVGRYDDALEAGATAPEALAIDLANTIGEVFYETGRIDEARASFDRAWDGGASDRHTARLNRAIAEWFYGDREVAVTMFDSFIDVYNGNAPLSAQDLTAIATAVRYLGVQDNQLFKDALRAYDEAIRADPSALDPRILLGEMFLEKYNGPEADAALKAVLSLNPNHPRALLGAARAMEFNGTVGVMDQVERALEQNPKLVPALVFKAGKYLEVEDHEKARAELEKALEINPASLEALSVLAASHYLRGESAEYERIRDQVGSLSAKYAELHNEIAELSGESRKYAEAARMASEAIEIDPRSWRAYGILGMNQLRLGQIEEGRRNLEKAFEGDPYNVWFFNTLDLLDTFENYQVTEDDPRFLFVLHDREADVLRPYIEQIASEAYDALSARYGGYTPPLPIRIEVYPSHADFSVRTVGLAGIGALGVSFGSVVAMDSPAAKPLGQFNWASVLWHELAHVFHLGISEHEVPRWFSEGLAVHEQRKARAGWGHQATPGFLERYKDGLMLPVSEMNAGFVQPQYPQQVVDSYLQASLVFDFIEGRWGFQPIVDMLHGYRNGDTTPQLVERLLGISMEELDQDFDGYFRNRYENALAALDPPKASPGMQSAPSTVQDWTRMARENPNHFHTRLKLGIALFREDRFHEAEEHLRAALRLFPEYGGLDSPYWFLAQIHERRGETELASRALGRLTSLNESHYEAFLQQGKLLGELGNVDGAAAAMDAAVLIYPFEIELHDRLAQAHADRGDAAGAVRERRAIVALAPADRATAYFRLAQAYVAAADPTKARGALLRALEIAPSYEEALELLLVVRGGGGGPAAEDQRSVGGVDR